MPAHHEYGTLDACVLALTAVLNIQRLVTRWICWWGVFPALSDRLRYGGCAAPRLLRNCFARADVNENWPVKHELFRCKQSIQLSEGGFMELCVVLTLPEPGSKEWRIPMGTSFFRRESSSNGSPEDMFSLDFMRLDLAVCI